MAKKRVDWEAVEKPYRAGMLSVREVALQFGCSETAIRKHAAEFGWERNLSKKVNRKVQNVLAREGIPEVPGKRISEKEIIDSAAASSVEVVRSHRRQISRSVAVISTLWTQLEMSASLVKPVEDMTDAEKKLAQKNLSSNAAIATSLSNALKTLVQLEREAFNITSDDLDDDNDNKPTNEITVKFVSAAGRVLKTDPAISGDDSATAAFEPIVVE